MPCPISDSVTTPQFDAADVSVRGLTGLADWIARTFDMELPPPMPDLDDSVVILDDESKSESSIESEIQVIWMSSEMQEVKKKIGEADDSSIDIITLSSDSSGDFGDDEESDDDDGSEAAKVKEEEEEEVESPPFDLAAEADRVVDRLLGAAKADKNRKKSGYVGRKRKLERMLTMFTC